MQSKKSLIKLMLLFIALPIYAQDEYSWLPITYIDWQWKENSEKNIHDAMILFERISTDDEELVGGKCYYSLYRRIKILSNQGRSWADVTVPLLDPEQEILDIQGRTVLPDGSIVKLKNIHIYDKEVPKTNDLDFSQKSFYLPGVTSDCIIEYYIKFMLPEPVNYWEIQKDIFQQFGSFTWKFYRGEGLNYINAGMLKELISPNYVLLNDKNTMKIMQEPDINHVEYVVFELRNVEPFYYEVHTLPDEALRTNLRVYYSSSVTPEVHWNVESGKQNAKGYFFLTGDDEIENITEKFSTLNSDLEKISAAYSWIKNNITNISDEPSQEEFDINKTVEDMIDNGYGTEYDINVLFKTMLTKMHINANLAHVTDRDKSIFVRDAKYWQFHHTLTAVRRGLDLVFYNPADKHLQFGQLPWYHEGIDAFLIGASDVFYSIPFSAAAQNKLVRAAIFDLDTSLNYSCEIIETHHGQFAYILRSMITDEPPDNQVHYLEDRMEELIPNCLVDSLRILGIEDLKRPVRIRYHLEIPFTGHTDSNFTIIKPFLFNDNEEYKFLSDERKYPIVFDFAKEFTESIEINIPENWHAIAIPKDSVFKNDVVE